LQLWLWIRQGIGVSRAEHTHVLFIKPLFRRGVQHKNKGCANILLRLCTAATEGTCDEAVTCSSTITALWHEYGNIDGYDNHHHRYGVEGATAHPYKQHPQLRRWELRIRLCAQVCMGICAYKYVRVFAHNSARARVLALCVCIVCVCVLCVHMHMCVYVCVCVLCVHHAIFITADSTTLSQPRRQTAARYRHPKGRLHPYGRVGRGSAA